MTPEQTIETVELVKKISSIIAKYFRQQHPPSQVAVENVLYALAAITATITVAGNTHYLKSEFDDAYNEAVQLKRKPRLVT